MSNIILLNWISHKSLSELYIYNSCEMLLSQNQYGWDFSGASNMSELQIYLEEAIMIR